MLLMEFHGSAASVEEQTAAVQEIAKEHGGHAFEWARTPDDFLRRRTTLALRGRTEPEVVQRVERLLGDQRQLAVLREAGDADADQP